MDNHPKLPQIGYELYREAMTYYAQQEYKRSLESCNRRGAVVLSTWMICLGHRLALWGERLKQLSSSHNEQSI